MLLNYEKLFEPYTGDGHTLENTLKYLKADAGKHNIPTEVMEIAINEVFTEMADGRRFNTKKCSCGCGIDKAATDLIHTIQRRMHELNGKVLEKTKEILNERYNTHILAHINQMNQDYINSQLPYKPWKETFLSKYYKLMNYKRSPIYKAIKRWL